MSKKLVAYYSYGGVTKRVAETLAKVAQADLFEIEACQPYTAADVDWTNKNSRSTIEMQDLNCRPAVCKKVENMDAYDTVYIGFPVWWGREPSIVDTFIDENDLSGKTVVPFCTSGGSGVEGSVARITELTAGKTCVTAGKKFPADASEKEITDWICK